ncbi:MAG: hypothetical protein ACTSRI_16060 [Promethearchaeota archaeon]
MEFKEVLDHNNNYFEEAICIYKNSFPVRERASIEELKQRFEKKEEVLHVGLFNGHVNVFGLIRVFKNQRFLLFDYFAVKESQRNKGHGTFFLKYLFKVLNLEKQEKYMLFELEHPNFGTDRQMRRQRVNFYKRFGVKELKNVNYFLPSFETNSENFKPLEMILMIYPITKRQKLTRTLLKKMIFSIYMQLYNQSEKSKFVLNVVNNIPEKIEIE